jgi:hypothetical protein
LAFYGAHLAAIRRFQGREAELAELAASIATSPTLIERECALAFAATLFALRAGRPQQAQALLERLRRDGLGAIPYSSSWLLAMLAVVELAAALEDGSIAQAAYDALLPYAELPIMASLAVVCFSSVHRALGVAALTCRKLDLAVEHLRAAVAASVRLGHRPAAIQARAELGVAHLQRGDTGDVQRGRCLLQEAMVDAEALGMTGLVAHGRVPQYAKRSNGPSSRSPRRMRLSGSIWLSGSRLAPSAVTVWRAILPQVWHGESDTVLDVCFVSQAPVHGEENVMPAKAGIQQPWRSPPGFPPSRE